MLLISIFHLFLPVARAEICPPGHFWYKAHPRSAYERKDGTPYAATFVTGSCLSRSKAAEFWWDKPINGKIDGWPHKREKFSDWKRSEMESFLKAMEKIPQMLWLPVKVARADVSETKGNTASNGPGYIVLYDTAFARSTNLSQLLTHELAHQYYGGLGDLQRTSYFEVAGWKEIERDKFSKPRNRRYVAPDGDLSPAEDFANNVEYFLFNPMRLKFISPNIYDWLYLEYGDKLKVEKGSK